MKIGWHLLGQARPARASRLQTTEKQWSVWRREKCEIASFILNSSSTSVAPTTPTSSVNQEVVRQQ